MELGSVKDQNNATIFRQPIIWADLFLSPNSKVARRPLPNPADESPSLTIWAIHVKCSLPAVIKHLHDAFFTALRLPGSQAL